MLETVRGHLNEGDPERARTALGRAVYDLFYDSFIQGSADPPLLSRRGRAFLAEVRAEAPSLVEDKTRAGYVERVLDEAFDALAAGGPPARPLFLANHALQLLVPELATRVEEAIEDARLELGRRAGDTSGFLPSATVSVDVLLPLEAVRHAYDNSRFRRVQDLELAGMDAPEDTIPGLPPIEGIAGERLVFRCPACARPSEEDFSRAGDASRCACGHGLRVPIPSLARMSAHLKARREEARGISRCRICRAFIQRHGNAFMRAGFCGASCAVRARERFGECVPREAARVGEEVVVTCHCRLVIRAAAADAGGCLPCPECGIDVWIPDLPPPRPPAAARPADVAPCAACGRPVKKSRPRCLWCGAPVENA